MKNEDLLLLLADKLEGISPLDYSIGDYVKSPIGIAGGMKEFQKRGFSLEHDGAASPSYRVVYQGAYDIDAAAKFFDITVFEALHLFDLYEVDEHGHSKPCPFNTKGLPNRKDEPAAWAAGRIKYFVRHIKHVVGKAA